LKPPKCRLCGHEHWNSQPHKFETEAVTCNHCVTKDAEIARLRNQVVSLKQELASIAMGIGETKPKRDRAEYMRDYRRGKKPLGIAYG
jgi:hypothetical protein